MMKKHFLLAAMIAGLVCTGCSQEEPEKVRVITVDNTTPAWDGTDTITISFARAFEVNIEPMQSRTRGDISSSANHLDVWLIQGSDTTEVHQTSEDADFGTIKLSVNRQKEDTLKAVGHKCSAAAEMKAGVVSFPAGEIKHTIYGQHTFKPDTINGNFDMEMKRIVGMLRFDITDSIPSKVKTIRFGISNTPTQFQTADFTGIAKTNRTADFSNFNRRADGSATFTVYVIPDDLTAQYKYDIEVSGLDKNGAAVESRAFSDVPIRANYRTQYQGSFFVTLALAFSFSIGDWQDYDVVNF